MINSNKNSNASHHTGPFTPVLMWFSQPLIEERIQHANQSWKVKSIYNINLRPFTRCFDQCFTLLTFNRKSYSVLPAAAPQLGGTHQAEENRLSITSGLNIVTFR